MTSGVVKASDPADGPTHYTFVPDEPLLPDTDVPAPRRRRPGHGRPAARCDDAVGPDGFVARGRPLPAARRHEERRSRGSDLGPLQQADGTAVDGAGLHGRASAASRSPARSAGRSRTRSSSSRRRRHCPYGATVSMDVAAGARDVAGAALAMAAHATFTTPAKPRPLRLRPSPRRRARRTTAVGGGSWAAVETYYLGLMNCTRTGGWVTSTGKCSSPGGRNVAPLKLDSGISSKVSRPYAKKLAVGADCSHFIGGNPGDRLRRRATRSTAGPRTSAAGPATPTPRSSARTSSSRARSRTTAGTTST